jgi:P-type conjugative transfer protein TrbJ
MSFNPARAQLAVACANCGSEWTQLANNAELVEQVANQARQLQQMLQQYQIMLQNTATLPQQVWGNAASDIAQVNSLIARTQSLSYASSNLAGAFASRFPGYQSYTDGQITAASMGGKYAQWSSDTSTTVLSTLQAIGTQSSQMQSEGALLQDLEGMSGSAQGQMQALEVGNQLAAQAVMQGQKLRQLMIANINLEAGYIQTQQDRQAVQDAAEHQFIDTNIPSNTGGERY